MSFRRFAARRGKQDANASAIIAALKRCGVSVVDLHAVGGGCPDILVGYRISEGWDLGAPRMVLLEIKTAKARPTQNAETWAKQEAFAREWKGTPVVTVRNEAEALTAVGIRLNE